MGCGQGREDTLLEKMLLLFLQKPTPFLEMGCCPDGEARSWEETHSVDFCRFEATLSTSSVGYPSLLQVRNTFKKKSKSTIIKKDKYIAIIAGNPYSQQFSKDMIWDEWVFRKNQRF